jgi:signal transduction histidine kinase
VTGAPLIVFAADKEGVLTFQDGQALQMLPESKGTKPGSHLSELFHDYPAILDDLQRVLAGAEFSYMLQIGGLDFECWFSPTRDRASAVTGLIGVATNVSERLKLQRQLLEISDREQARMGQEIHDGLSQKLVSMAFDANSLEHRLEQEGRPEAVTARKLAALLDEAITESRQLARGLFPIRLEADGLRFALEELAQITSDRFGIDCRFEESAIMAVPSQSAAIHLYRIAQEAVTNAARHAKASRIHVTLEQDGDWTELSVEDDGVGIAPENHRPDSGMGLHIMDYRARSFGGHLRIRPRTRGGTTVSCRFKSKTVLRA